MRALARHGRPVEWKHFAQDRPIDLLDRLRAAGFEPEEPETRMALPLDAPLDARIDAPADGATVRSVTADEVERVDRVHARVWPEHAGVATVDAGPMSRPILERLGFSAFTVTTPCVAVPPDA